MAELKSKLLTPDFIDARLRWCLAEDGEAPVTSLLALLRQRLAVAPNGSALRASISLATSGDSDAQPAPNLAGALARMADAIATSTPSAAPATAAGHVPTAAGHVFPIDDWDIEINDDSFGHVLTLPTDAECAPDHAMYTRPTLWILYKLVAEGYDTAVYGSFTPTSAVRAQCKRVGGKLKTYTIPNLAKPPTTPIRRRPPLSSRPPLVHPEPRNLHCN